MFKGIFAVMPDKRSGRNNVGGLLFNRWMGMLAV
ncbi:hypothetical protein EDC30_10661 [Paucimonas lemoignei]|uniref:Uncharacterized protein n=1 Tax=Paucimonas lemoignei TaxID=29443 RepID=A0A4R3HWA0_PAULE|nr:hypothetical protein EDC30_10661 [Paucimonas lemoignei]